MSHINHRSNGPMMANNACMYAYMSNPHHPPTSAVCLLLLFNKTRTHPLVQHCCCSIIIMAHYVRTIHRVTRPPVCRRPSIHRVVASSTSVPPTNQRLQVQINHIRGLYSLHSLPYQLLASAVYACPPPTYHPTGTLYNNSIIIIVACVILRYKMHIHMYMVRQS